MARYLTNVVETYRVDTELEAKELIESAKKDSMFTLKKYGSEYKEKKAKGEIIDSYYKVTLNKWFTDEKEPTDCTAIMYTMAFPPESLKNNEDSEDDGIVDED